MKRWETILGKVAFVNCDPLFHELPKPWEILHAPPSWLTGHVLRKDCLLAPIPTADFAKNSETLQLLPNICIASDGAVGSVLLFGNTDPSMMRDIALPTDSATSRKLCMWLLKQMGLNPRPVDMGPDLSQMLDRCDGALLDLGQAWKDVTGYPMVFAVYAARKDAPPTVLTDAHNMLLRQLHDFEESYDVRQNVIEATSKRSGFTTERIDKYFGEVINRLDELGMKGLNHFLTEVCGVEDYQLAQTTNR